MTADRAPASRRPWLAVTPHVIAVLIALGLMGLNGLMISLMQLVPGFLGMSHFTEPHHRIHDLTFGFIFVPAAIGLLAQLRRPSQNVAGQLMALVPWVALVLTVVLTSVLVSNTSALNPAWIGPAAFTLASAGLHPAGRDLFRSVSVSRASWLMVAMVVTAAGPLLAFASTNIGLQGTGNEHAVMGHYGFTAAFGLTVIGVGLVASLRPEGWRITAWVAGVLPVLLGLASLVFPVDSSLDIVWSIASIVWGVTFVTAAELTRGAQPTVARSMTGEPPDRASTTSTSRIGWVLVIVAIALVLVFAGMHFAGGGIPVH